MSVRMVVSREHGEFDPTGTRHCVCGMSWWTGHAQKPFELRYFPRNWPELPGSIVGCASFPPCTRWNRCLDRLEEGREGEKLGKLPE
jgi:hypothetical protein